MEAIGWLTTIKSPLLCTVYLVRAAQQASFRLSVIMLSITETQELDACPVKLNRKVTPGDAGSILHACSVYWSKSWCCHRRCHRLPCGNHHGRDLDAVGISLILPWTRYKVTCEKFPLNQE